MTSNINQYLDSIRDNLRLDLQSETEVISELQTHIEDNVDEMKESGLSEEEAANACIKLFGSAKLVARQIYETHSQGSWKQALLASIPHLLFALLFALNWWQGIGWVVVTLSIVLSIAIYGWLRGRPIWLFPWLGYSLIPVIAAGLLLLYLPRVLSWVAILIYIPFALWLVYSVTIRTIKRDWLYSALTLLPLPIIIGWSLAVGQEGKFPKFSPEYIDHFGHWIGLSFLALACTAAIFIRLRKRWLRATLLFVSQFIILIMVTCYAEGRLGLTASSVIALIMVGLLTGLALADKRTRFRSAT